MDFIKNRILRPNLCYSGKTLIDMVPRITWVLLVTICLNAIPVRGQNLTVSNVPAGQNFEKGTQVLFEATIRNVPISDPVFLRVYNNLTGWRKLKIGNNPNTLFTPKVDVLAGGNKYVELIIKQVSQSLDWSKIQIRPGGVTANPITIAPYIQSGTNLKEWFIVAIPLEKFDPTTPFNALTNIEFPYSTGATGWEMAIASIRFTGGSTPYIWLGPGGRGLNIHDGTGGAGAVFANWVSGSNSGPYVPTVSLSINGQEVKKSMGLPLKYSWIASPAGDYTFKAASFLGTSMIEETGAIPVKVIDNTNYPPVVTESEPLIPDRLPVGKVISQIFQSTDPEGDPVTIQVLFDGALIGESATGSLKANLSAGIHGDHVLTVRATDSKGGITAMEKTLHFDSPVLDETAGAIVSPLDGYSTVFPAVIDIKANVTQPSTESYKYLYITVPGTGYRKLKLGNNATSLYSPKVDVIGAGNDSLILEMKDFNFVADWSKIIIAPMEITTDPVSLKTYWDKGQLLTDGWRRMSIPLNKFSPLINFRSINYIAIPYSQNAGNFIIGLRRIEFTGSTQPYLWFGGAKTNNIHDGLGGSGQLLAELKTFSPDAVLAPTVLFALNDTVVAISQAPDYSTSIALTHPGAYKLEAFTIDDGPQVGLLAPVTFKSDEPVADDGYLTLNLGFSSDPGSIQITMATLKYNKDFALSFTFDDALIDAYTNAYPLLHGGTVLGNGLIYPGLFYTDGCGNPISFRGAIAWFSVNSSYKDIHTVTPGYITWDQLKELYNNGWDVINHSYSHDYGTGTDYMFEVTENQKVILEKTGILVNQFAIPSGDLNYVPFAFQAGNLSLYSNKSNFLGFPAGINVSEPFTYTEPKIYRRFLYDDSYNATNVDSLAKVVAAQGAAGKHVWLNDFTHRIHFTTISGSLRFETFAAYMQSIADKFGKNGTDKIWMAPAPEVFEYLTLRQSTKFTQERSGNDIILKIDTAGLPADYRRYEWSFVVNTDKTFTVSSNDPDITWINSTGNPFGGLINLKWDKSGKSGLKSAYRELMNFSSLTFFENGLSFNIFPNPAKDFINVDFLTEVDNWSYWRILDLSGKVQKEGKFLDQTSMNDGKTMRINLNLKPGLYLLECSNASNCETVEFLVQ
jgi:hypothetical protein